MASARSKAPGRTGRALGAALTGALLWAAPRPHAAVHLLTAGTTPAAPVVAAAALLAWLLVLWLAAVGLLTSLSRARGPAGAVSRALLRRAAPLAVRRVVALALGIGVALSAPAHAADPAPAGAAAASAVPATAAADSPANPFDWPAPTPLAAAPTPAAGQAAGATATAPDVAVVVVRPGDSLWRLAAARLPAAAPAGQVAAAWPTWWATNRTVIGDDPDLLHPGQRLRPPP